MVLVKTAMQGLSQPQEDIEMVDPTAAQGNSFTSTDSDSEWEYEYDQTETEVRSFYYCDVQHHSTGSAVS
jgi:hypothetical protein